MNDSPADLPGRGVRVLVCVASREIADWAESIADQLTLTTR